MHPATTTAEAPLHSGDPRAELRAIGVDASTANLPLLNGDATAGSESEWQAAVIGPADRVDLAMQIAASDLLAALRRRARAGDIPATVVADLERHIAPVGPTRWENSWVRIPLRRLGPRALDALAGDGAVPHPDGPGHARLRRDATQFHCMHDGHPAIRVPISYLLKLALRDAVTPELGPMVARLAVRAEACLLNDHVSPETHSFHVTRVARELGSGRALAREVSRRMLIAELLLRFADARYGLSESGQRAVLYSGPHPPARQRALAGVVSDTFYRALYTSPCLAGWPDGEAKLDYMATCHRALTRAQVTAVLSLRDAGLIGRDTVHLPGPTVSLSNNGIHISVGSDRLSAAASAGALDVRAQTSIGALVIKITEHFLPLLVGTYTAAPYRFDYSDVHPERMLGFLPLQLDPTHLRALWRRWQKKAVRRTVVGRRTPSGVPVVDTAYARLTGQRGDWVPDARLLDYLVAPLSPAGAPALSGTPDAERRFRDALHHAGVMDASMATYLPVKQRTFERHGFVGSEWRTHSTFFQGADVAQVVDLQVLVGALAYRWVASGAVTHADIPDDPETESERRQVMFACAAGVPTVYVRRQTPNRVLARVLTETSGTRLSRRYPGTTRVPVAELRLAMVSLLRREAADLIEALDVVDLLDDLGARLVDERVGAAGRITASVCRRLGVLGALGAPAAEFNAALEDWYADDHRADAARHGLEGLIDDAVRIDALRREQPLVARSAVAIAGQGSLAVVVRRHSAGFAADGLGEAAARELIATALLAGAVDASDQVATAAR